MTPRERKAQTTTLFHEALAKPAERRLDYIREASAGDAKLFDKVRELLEAYVEVETAVPSDGSDDSPSVALQSIDTLIDLSDRYEEIKFIGEGGMGVVYRAYDREIGKIVALKTLHPRLAADSRIVERLRNETRLALDITHRNVCRIYGLERINGRLLIAMEYVDGETLRSVLDRVRGVSVPQGLVWASEICEAIGAAHEKKIVHRDLKPENIMLDREGHIKVMDFGIACSLQATGDQIGGNPGTPLYMSPEQRDGRPVEPRSDIYSLGLVLYELFTGVRREPGSTIPPAAVNRYLPAHIDDAIGRCLEPSPADRFQSMAELKAALANDQAVGRTGQARTGVTGRRFSTSARLAALCVLSGVLGLIAYLLTRPPARGHEDKVNVLAFSPDGRILASGSEDKTIILWDATTRHRIRTLTDHVRAITSLAFSGDSRWLASGSSNGSIEVADVATGRVRTTLSDTKEIQALALSPPVTHRFPGRAQKIDTTLALYVFAQDVFNSELPQFLERFRASLEDTVGMESGEQPSQLLYHRCDVASFREFDYPVPFCLQPMASLRGPFLPDTNGIGVGVLDAFDRNIRAVRGAYSKVKHTGPTSVVVAMHRSA
jgi:serine/threonine protein kinase